MIPFYIWRGTERGEREKAENPYFRGNNICLWGFENEGNSWRGEVLIVRTRLENLREQPVSWENVSRGCGTIRSRAIDCVGVAVAAETSKSAIIVSAATWIANIEKRILVALRISCGTKASAYVAFDFLERSRLRVYAFARIIASCVPFLFRKILIYSRLMLVKFCWSRLNVLKGIDYHRDSTGCIVVLHSW